MTFPEHAEPNNENPIALITGLQTAYLALREARSDFERLQIRNQARAASVAAEVLKRRDIQAEASILVAAAERAIAKANPPQQGRRTDLDNDFGFPEPEVDENLVRNIRKAHYNLTDEQFEAVAQRAREEQEPLTRNVLKREARKLNPPVPNDQPDREREPTRTERLEAQVDVLKMEVQEKAQRVQDLEEEVRFLRGETSEFDHEREATFNRQQALISSLRGARDEWMMKAKDNDRRANWWERQAKAQGWKPSQGFGDEQIPLPKVDETGGAEETVATDHPDNHGPEDFEMEDPQPPPWELAQWVGPFRKGDWVVLPSGEQGVVQDLAPDGRAMVATEYGAGRIKPFGFDEIKSPEEPRSEDPEAGL